MDDGLLKLFIIIAGMLVVARLISLFSKAGFTPKKPCTLHLWPKEGKFVCSKCGFEAGSFQSDKGEY